MRLTELFPLALTNESHDAEHQHALDQTGFWGKQGAGCLFLARSTKRFLIAHRSRQVEQPGSWGTWGGAIDTDEQPTEAVRREASEEAGHVGHLSIVPLLIFASGSFRYHNFLAVVDDEFTPVLNWENQGYRWCEWGDWPTPLHFGLAALFADSSSVTMMQKMARAATSRTINESNYRFVTDCTKSCHGRYGEAIHAMKRKAKIIDFDDLVRMVGMAELAQVFPDPASLEQDWSVTYYQSYWRGIPCVYVVHSGIEHIFTRNGELPKARKRVGQKLIESSDYLYHATNIENALTILATGKINTFGPSYGTDQSTWPDGGRERRAYFTASPTTAAAFHPEYGRPILLRLHKSAAAFQREKYSSDQFSRHPVKARGVEYQDAQGEWHPLVELRHV